VPPRLDDRATASVASADELEPALHSLGLGFGVPVVVVVGGAEGVSAADAATIRTAFADAVLPAAASAGATIVDGGTSSGVMRLLGEEHGASGVRTPLVGVVVERLARDDPSLLDPGHTHFVLVPGEDWGDESAWLAAVARTLAGDAATVTLLANGGDIALRDVARSVEDARPVIVLAGSGRTADELAAAETPRAHELVRTQLVSSVAASELAAVRAAVEDAVRERS
jgi:SLOG in TRPM, prokaryote